MITDGERPLVLACDAAYAMQLATAMRSIVDANLRRWPLRFHVLSEGFREEARRRVLDSLGQGAASVEWISVDTAAFQAFATLPFISKMTFARLLIPAVLPAGLSRVLYLDADLVVLDDLGPLWDTNLDGAVLGAVTDLNARRIKDGEPGFEGVPRVREYFNAGVLLIDLERWREERVSERAMEYLSRHPAAPFSDQDALNATCDGRWKRLDPRWNFQDHQETRIRDLGRDRRPAIVHFISSRKPWKPSAINPNAALYDSFRSRTLFARTLGQRCREIAESGWFRLKRRLRRYALLRAAWSVIKRAGRGAPRPER